MKTTFLLILSFCFSFFSFSQFEKGTTVVNLSAGLNSSLLLSVENFRSAKWSAAAFAAIYKDAASTSQDNSETDRGDFDDAAFLFSKKRRNTQKASSFSKIVAQESTQNYTAFGGMIQYHLYNTSSWNAFLGAYAGYQLEAQKNNASSDNKFVAGAYLGGRYRFHPQWSARLEAGYSFSILNLGLSYTF
jgi:hypothetical protein